MKEIVTLFPLMLLALLTLVLAPAHGAQERGSEKQTDLSLRKVVLFQNGVGYFELEATVPPDKEIELRLAKDQMNDILKSLTILNLSGGQVSTVRYDSARTPDQEKKDYPFDLPSNQGLAWVLRQLQGSEIAMRAGNTRISGYIVGVEERPVLVEGQPVPVFYLCVMDKTGELRSFDTAEIQGVEFQNTDLRQDLKQYLNVLGRKHQTDRKSVGIRASGEGPQHLVISYVTEMPVWKMTYRVVLPREEKPDGKPFVQGWAVVDNVTGQDWEDVDLSLVSGLPISFVHNLYDPRYRKRPVIAVKEEPAVLPRAPEAARASMPRAAPRPAMENGALMSLREAPMVMEAMPSEYAPRATAQDLEEEFRRLRAEAGTREIGDLFEYHIEHPIRLAHNQSALVPIVSSEMEGEAVDLYNESMRQGNPLSAVRLHNTSGMTLEGGTITVFQGGTYGGEAIMETVKPDQWVYIPYAVDIGLSVSTRHGTTSEEVRRIVVNRGVVRIHRGVVETRTYTLNNRNDAERKVIIEHPRQPGWEILDDLEPVDTTENYQRFEVLAPANEETLFAVREMRDRVDTLMVRNLTPDDLFLFAQEGFFTQETQQRLGQILALKSEIADLGRKITELAREREGVMQDQQRLRENLKALGQTVEEKTLRSRYIDRLDFQETRLEEVNQTEADLRTQQDRKQREMEQAILELEQDIAL